MSSNLQHLCVPLKLLFSPANKKSHGTSSYPASGCGDSKHVRNNNKKKSIFPLYFSDGDSEVLVKRVWVVLVGVKHLTFRFHSAVFTDPFGKNGYMYFDPKAANVTFTSACKFIDVQYNLNYARLTVDNHCFELSALALFMEASCCTWANDWCSHVAPCCSSMSELSALGIFNPYFKTLALQCSCLLVVTVRLPFWVSRAQGYMGGFLPSSFLGEPRKGK